jgi:hypothetical protein
VQLTPPKLIQPISFIFLPDAATREPPPAIIPPDELEDELLELLEELEDELLEELEDELLELLEELEDELLELLEELEDELLAANSTTPDFTGSVLAMYEVSCTVWEAPFGSVHVTATLACLQSTELAQPVIVQVRVKVLLAPVAVSLPESRLE